MMDDAADQRRVWIAQCLCGPARHCILACAAEAVGVPAATLAALDPLRQQVADLLREGILNAWCGLCGAKEATWRYELGRTAFRTIGEATPELRRVEADQAVAREAMGDAKGTA